MIIILGLVILAAAAVAGVAGFFNNIGSAHALDGSFALFGYHVTGSTGTLFVFGIVVGAIAMLGLGLLLTGARRTSRRRREAHSELQRSQRENAASIAGHDALVQERDSARAEAASAGHEREELTRQREDLANQHEDLANQHEDLVKQHEELNRQREDLVKQRELAYASSPGASARARQREREEMTGAHEEVVGRRERLNAASPGTREGPLPSGKGRR
jgi:hypothetical protein